ncbi:hypothetical protein VTI28DRAFT_4870 [Corynascus sepedonium]
MATTNSNLSQNDDPPFPAKEAHMGGVPTSIPDTPVTIIFLILFAVALGLETLLYRLDCTRAPLNVDCNDDEDDDSHHHRRRYLSSLHILHPFPLIPALRITFLLTRLAALATRLAWTYHPRAHGASDLEVASTILAPAGSVLLLVANPLLARRFARDYAAFGPHPAVARTARAAVFCAVVSLVMAVSTHADAYFTREREELDRGRSVWLVAECIRLAVALLPVLGVLIAHWLLLCGNKFEEFSLLCSKFIWMATLELIRASNPKISATLELILISVFGAPSGVEPTFRESKASEGCLPVELQKVEPDGEYYHISAVKI